VIESEGIVEMDIFLKAWRSGGLDGLREMYTKDPLAYLRVLLGLLPEKKLPENNKG